jgi:ribosomal protein L2
VIKEIIHDPGRGAPLVRVAFRHPYKYVNTTIIITTVIILTIIIICHDHHYHVSVSVALRHP